MRITAVRQNDELAQRLKDVYSLRECFVADVNPDISSTIRNEAVAHLAVEKILPAMFTENTVGFSGGNTVGRFVDMIPDGLPQLRDKHWIPLDSLDITHEPEVHESPNRIVSRMAYRQNGSTAHMLYHLPPDDRLGIHNNKKSLTIRSRQVMQRAKQLNLAIISVGSYDYLSRPQSGYNIQTIQNLYHEISSEKPDHCVGLILNNLIDRDGKFPGNAEQEAFNNSLVYSLGVEDLKNIAVDKSGLVWCLAAHPSKALAVRAGIRAQAINALVVDSVVAQLLIDLADDIC